MSFKNPDCERLKSIEMGDREAVAHFLASHVFSEYEGLQERANSQACVEFFDFCGGKSIETIFSAFLHTYITNPPRQHLNANDLLVKVNKQYPNERQPFKNLKHLEQIQYDPLERVHKIAIYLTFLAFIRPQYTGSNVPNYPLYLYYMATLA